MMKKRFKCLCLILSGLFAFGGLCGLSSRKFEPAKSNTPAFASELSQLGAITIEVDSDSRLNEKECVLTLQNDSLNGAQINCHYVSIGNKKGQELYDEYLQFKSLFKKKTSQAKIGKLVKISLSCEDNAVQTTIKGGVSANIRIYFPANLLSKNYAIYVGTSATDRGFKPVDDSKIKIDNGDIIMDITAYETFYIALIYDGSYIIVWLCVGGFILILAVCIIFKIRKMHKDDPEYYKAVKNEKQQKKNNRQNMNNQYKNQQNNKNSNKNNQKKR